MKRSFSLLDSSTTTTKKPDMQGSLGVVSRKGLLKQATFQPKKPAARRAPPQHLPQDRISKDLLILAYSSDSDEEEERGEVISENEFAIASHAVKTPTPTLAPALASAGFRQSTPISIANSSNVFSRFQRGTSRSQSSPFAFHGIISSIVY